MGYTDNEVGSCDNHMGSPLRWGESMWERILSCYSSRCTYTHHVNIVHDA